MAEDPGGDVVKRIRNDYFSEEIVTEILARLPVKSLLRFRCVCKSWCAIIADSHFVKKQLSYAESRNSMLLFLQDPPLSIDYESKKYYARSVIRKLQFPVQFPDGYKIIRVLGSCNGLVCFEFESVGIFLCNPCTRYSELLPDPPIESHRLDLYGFGYDSTADDYKVVTGRSLVHVFAMKSGSWRTIRDLDCAGVEGKGCLVNGALHWLVKGIKPSRIVSFSLAEEKFEEMVPLLDHDRAFDGVLVYRDRLCVYEIKDGAPGFVSVWLMEEYGVKESWTKIIHFPLQKSGREEFRPMCILQNGEILMHRILYEVYDGPDPYPDPDPYDQFDYPDPDEFEYPEYPYSDPDEFDPFDDPEVYDGPDPYESDYPDPDPFDDPEEYYDPYDELDDPVDEFNRLCDDYSKELWERHSTMVLVDQTGWQYEFDVDFGFGAAIYKETLLSSLTAADMIPTIMENFGDC